MTHPNISVDNKRREQEETLHHKGIPVLYKPFDLDELLHLVRHVLPASSKS